MHKQKIASRVVGLNNILMVVQEDKAVIGAAVVADALVMA